MMIEVKGTDLASIEKLISYTQHSNEYLSKTASSYQHLHKTKMYIQVGDNIFIIGDDAHKVTLPDEKYNLYWNLIDDVLVARYK